MSYAKQLLDESNSLMKRFNRVPVMERDWSLYDRANALADKSWKLYEEAINE